LQQIQAEIQASANLLLLASISMLLFRIKYFEIMFRVQHTGKKKVLHGDAGLAVKRVNIEINTVFVYMGINNYFLKYVLVRNILK
jgi:hypothetical protein